jgi:hypothetical protein
MAAGATLVPCLEWEGTDSTKACALLCGTPIALPKTTAPSGELVADVHATYVAGIQALYARHQAALGLEGVALRIR